MKKYATIFSLALARAVVYRSISLLYLFISLLNILLSFAVWSIAYKSPTFRSNESFMTLMTYFMLVVLLNPLVQAAASGVIAEDHIKRGELSLYLLKPFPYFIYMYILEIPWRFLQFFMSLPLVILLFLPVRAHFHFDMRILIPILLVIFFANILSFLIHIFFGMLAFWFEDVRGFLNLLEILTLLFSGVGLPLFFFPPLLSQFARVLPFQYILYFPISLFLKRLVFHQFFYSLAFLLGWIVVFGMINYFMWKQGLKRFSGEGI